jgi:outer membrane protein TolC
MSLRDSAGRVCVAAFILVAAAARAVQIDLLKAERMALDSSAELRSLEDQAASAVYALKLGFRDYLPQLSLDYLDSSNVVTGGADAASIQWSLTVKQPLYNGGRRLRQRRLAEADIELRWRGIKDKKREIRESIDTAYYRVLMLKRKIGVQRDTLAIADQELKIARAQRALGTMRDIDLLESELQRSSLEISLRSSEADLEESEFNLRLLLGLRHSETLELLDDFDAEYEGLELPGDRGFFASIVLEGNLGLRQRQGELRKKMAALVEARQWYLPNISFEGSLSLSGERYPLQSASLNGKLVFEIPVPTSPVSFSISSGGSTAKQKAKGSSIGLDPLSELSALVESEAAAKEYAVMQRQIDDMGASLEFQVRKDIAAYVRARDSLEMRRKDLALQLKKADIQKMLVDIGEAKRVDYLKTLTTAAEGESAILESILDLRQSERSLEGLIGLETGALAQICSSYAAELH